MNLQERVDALQEASDKFNISVDDKFLDTFDIKNIDHLTTTVIGLLNSRKGDVAVARKGKKAVFEPYKGDNKMFQKKIKDALNKTFTHL